MSPCEEWLSVREIAQELGVSPTRVSRLFYQGKIRHDIAPMVGGRRVVRREHLWAVGMAMGLTRRPEHAINWSKFVPEPAVAEAKTEGR